MHLLFCRSPVTVSGVSGKYWSLIEQLSGGGVGLRYQRADDFLPTVELQKTVNGSALGDLRGFEFTFTSVSGEKRTFVTDSDGKIVTYLAPGTYTVTETPKEGYTTPEATTITVSSDLSAVQKFTVNNVMPAGTLHISKVAEDGNYSRTSFVISSARYEDFEVSLTAATSGSFVVYQKDGNGAIYVTYSITTATCGDGATCKRINLYGLPVTVQEPRVKP